MKTFLVELESTLNSRPLTSLSNDYNDLQVLTPNHYLTGKLTKYFSEFSQSDINSRKPWKPVQALVNMFWTRFIKEYLPTLQERKKWNKVTRNFVINDIVLIKNKNVPRSSFPLAHIIDVHVGSDGIVRSCKIKLGNNILVRPCKKLYLFEEAD